MPQEKIEFPERPYTRTEIYKSYSDAVDLFCQFSKKLELLANDSTYDFMKRRMDFLHEEVKELQDAIEAKNDAEILDGAMDVAFLAITQAYHLLRMKGFEHHAAVMRVRWSMHEIGETNMVKNPPKTPGDKITKPEGWAPPDLEKILLLRKKGDPV